MRPKIETSLTISGAFICGRALSYLEKSILLNHRSQPRIYQSNSGEMKPIQFQGMKIDPRNRRQPTTPQTGVFSPMISDFRWPESIEINSLTMF